MTNCSGCGAGLRETDRFCSNCGESSSGAPAAIIQAGIPAYRKVSARRRLGRTGGIAARIALLILFAAGSWLGYAYYKHQLDDERFARNARCAQLARDFAKSRADDGGETTVLYDFFSSKRNSCVAALERRLSNRFVVQVADPVTGEVIWVKGCSIPEECTGNLISTMRFDVRDAIGRYADRPLDRPVIPPPD